METPNPAVEDYIRRTLDFTTQLYSLDNRSEGNQKLLEPINPLLVSVHSSLLSLVEAARHTPSSVLKKDGGRFSLWGTRLQIALHEGDLPYLIFCRANFQLPRIPWPHHQTRLEEVMMVRAGGAENMDYARVCNLDLVHRDTPRWLDYRTHVMSWESHHKIEKFDSFLEVNFSWENGKMRGIVYGTSGRDDFQRVTSIQLPATERDVREDPWVFNLKFGEDHIEIEFHRLKTITEYKTNQDGDLVNSHGSKFNDILPRCLESIFGEFSIPVLSQSLG